MPVLGALTWQRRRAVAYSGSERGDVAFCVPCAALRAAMGDLILSSLSSVFPSYRCSKGGLEKARNSFAEEPLGSQCLRTSAVLPTPPRTATRSSGKSRSRGQLAAPWGEKGKAGEATECARRRWHFGGRPAPHHGLASQHMDLSGVSFAF